MANFQVTTDTLLVLNTAIFAEHVLLVLLNLELLATRASDLLN